MKYVVTVNGSTFDVEVPNAMTFEVPVTDEEARAAIAKLVAEAAEPHLVDFPPYKQVIRNEKDQISGIVERPAIPAAALAAQVGREVARAHLPEGEE